RTQGFFARAPADTHVLVTLMTDSGGDFELGREVASLRSLTLSASDPNDALTDPSRPVLVQVYAAQRRIGARVVTLPDIRKETFAARVDMGTELLVGGTALTRTLWASGPRVVTEATSLWAFWTYEIDPAHPTSWDGPAETNLAPYHLAELESVPIRAAIGDY